MKGVWPERDLTGMPLEVPNLPEEQYRLPLLGLTMNLEYALCVCASCHWQWAHAQATTSRL
jgi:hypothetical protein